MGDGKITAMKLRIRGDSLRFRLTQAEVAKLAGKEKVSESVHFSPSAKDILTYSVEASEGVTRFSAVFASAEILVRVPASLVESWAHTDQVGMESTRATGEGRKLRILIEKDFQCLQPRSEEDESDNFPNPQQTAGPGMLKSTK